MFSEVLVGNHIEIVESLDKTFLSLRGEIVNESKFMLTIRNSKNELARIPKKAVKFVLREANSGPPRVLSGIEVIGTAWDRIQKS